MSWYSAYLDAGLCGSAQPVAVGGEAQSMNDITSIQTVQPLALCQVPQHGNTVLQPSYTTWQHYVTRSAQVAGSVHFA